MGLVPVRRRAGHVDPADQQPPVARSRISWQTANWVNFAEDGVTQNDRSILENATNYRYGATTLLTAPKARTGRGAQRFSLSYVTGTHNIKVGVTDEQGFNDESRSRNNVVDGAELRLPERQAVPPPVLRAAVPGERAPEHGTGRVRAGRVEDQPIHVEPRLRYDRVSMGYNASVAEAGPYVPRREAPALSGVPIYNDINPRVGVAMDVFGNGRTALKFSVGRYNQLSRGDFTSRFHPFNSSMNSAFRTWTDVNGNYTPDCDVRNLSTQDLSASGGDICGAMSDAELRQVQPDVGHLLRLRKVRQPRFPVGHQHRTPARNRARAVVERRLQPQLGWQLHDHGQHAA